MADLEWKRPMPTGAWVTVNNPGPGDVAIYRWDPNAKVERVEALAKGLDHEADMIEAEGSDGVEAYVDAARSDAYRIRTALNGETRA